MDRKESEHTEQLSTFERIRNGILRFTFDVVNLIAGFVLKLIYSRQKKVLPPITNPILLDSAQDLALKIRTKKIKCVDVIEAFISRIREVNPIINAVVDERFSEALEDAEAADDLIRSNTKTEEQLAEETPLLGIPFTIKDSFEVKGLKQTNGHVGRKDIIATGYAEVVQLMRKAGAIPLGVTNVPELSMWWETSNNIYGTTNNPYDTSRTVGGSSGGEGSILSAAGSCIGIGTDIGGSIRIPAVFNGIFGHKPSKGNLISLVGKFPETEGKLLEYTVAGPMCRFASDLVLAYQVLAGDKVKQLKLNEQVDLKKIKLYYMEDDGGSVLTSRVHPEIRNALNKVVTHLEEVCGTKAHKLSLNQLRHSYSIFYSKYSNGSTHPFFYELGLRNENFNPFWEFLKWHVGLSNHTLPALVLALKSKFRTTKLEASCDAWLQELQTKFKECLEDGGVFLYPTLPTLPLYHNQPLFCPYNVGYTSIFNILGYPSTTCPVGLSNEENLPIGIQVVSWFYNDHLSLAVARELENTFGGWVPPCSVSC